MVVRSKWITRRKNGFSGFGAGITGTGIVSVSGTIACDLESQKPSSGHAPAGLSGLNHLYRFSECFSRRENDSSSVSNFCAIRFPP